MASSASTLSGLGSGIDTQSLISGLVQASSAPLTALQKRQQQTQAAVSTLSGISSALSKLQTAVNALSTANGVGSNSATSSASAIAVTTSGNASPGAYSIDVLQLAQEQRSYSTTFDSASSALNQSGTLAIQVGSGNAKEIDVNATDTLDQLASKINSAGLRVSASVFFDGSKYRLQIRGLDSGADNAVALTQTGGVALGYDDPASTVQQAQNSKIKVDGFEVQRSTNQVVGAISGVTLALTAKTTSPVTVQVATSPQGLETKLQSVVSAYNAVISQVKATSGTIVTAADGSSSSTGNPVLTGDFTLRSITNRLSDTLHATFGSGQLDMLANVGLSLQKDGTLSLNADKLEAALSSDPSGVINLFAGPNDSGGAMKALSTTIDIYTQTGTGLLNQEQDDMNSKVRDLGKRISTEQSRLDTYQALLTKQFTAMDTTVTGNNAQLTALQQAFASILNTTK